MTEQALFFYGLLVMFVMSCMQRNIKAGRTHVRQLIYTAWGLFAVSISAAGYLSFTALGIALRA